MNATHRILMGYRGCGKSTLGPRWAAVLGVTFVDLDDAVVEHLQSATIADAWATHGEPTFRQAEYEVLSELLRHGAPAVIALGGGAVMYDPNHALLKDEPTVMKIYLRATPQTLHARLTCDAQRADRPARAAGRDTLEFIETQLALRAPRYESLADHILDVDTLSCDEVLGQLSKV